MWSNTASVLQVVGLGLNLFKRLGELIKAPISVKLMELGLNENERRRGAETNFPLPFDPQTDRSVKNSAQKTSQGKKFVFLIILYIYLKSD